MMKTFIPNEFEKSQMSIAQDFKQKTKNVDALVLKIVCEKLFNDFTESLLRKTFKTVVIILNETLLSKLY